MDSSPYSKSFLQPLAPEAREFGTLGKLGHFNNLLTRLHGQFVLPPDQQDMPIRSAAGELAANDEQPSVHAAVAALLKHLPRVSAAALKLELVRGRGNEYFLLYVGRQFFEAFTRDTRRASKRITPVGFARSMWATLGMYDNALACLATVIALLYLAFGFNNTSVTVTHQMVTAQLFNPLCSALFDSVCVSMYL